MEAFKRFCEPVENQQKEEEDGSHEVSIFADGCFEVAIDNSGSTGGGLIDESTVLDGTKKLLSSIWGDNVQVIAWNSRASRVELSSIYPTGGTAPGCIFPLLRDCSTLLITTDGEISHSYVQRLEPLILESSLVNVIAVYISSSSNDPASLNLPVFAPFLQNVVGRVVVCHFDGVHLRVLLKNCKGEPSLVETALPDPPNEIREESTWKDFPVVSPRDLLKITLPKRLESLSGVFRLGQANKDPRVLFDSSWWNLEKLREEIAQVLATNSGTEDDSKLTFATADLLQDLTGSSRTSTHRELLRRIIQIWYTHATDQARNRVLEIEKERSAEQQRIYGMKHRANGLLETLHQEQDLTRRKALQQELSQLTSAVFHHEETLRLKLSQATKPVEQRYNAMVQQLSELEKGDRDYSLQGLANSLTSNRARRAQAAGAQTYGEQGWDLEGAHETECDICAESKPQALLAICLPTAQIEYNTGDFALNDAFSLGSGNAQYLPNSSLCIFCAYFLVSSNKDCPYTRQKIATILPVVKNNGGNFKRLANNISHWLFEGKQLHLEWQALLAVLDTIRVRGGTTAEAALDFVEREYVPRIKVNFEGLGHSSKPLLEAIKDVFCTSEVECQEYYALVAETYLTPLRNKSLESLSVIARVGIRFGVISPTNVTDVMNRLLMKTIVGRALGWCKERESKKVDLLEFPRLLESDLYDTSVGFPIKGSGRVLSSLADSKFLLRIFGKSALEKFLLKPMAQWSEEVHQVSRRVVTVLMYTFLTDWNYQTSTESFFMELPDEHPLTWLAFTSPSAITTAEAQGLLAQLNQDVQAIEEKVHREATPCFSPALMLAPAVVCCGSCGLPFIHPQEVRDYRDSSRDKQEEVAKVVMGRRADHFRQVFKSDSKSGMVDRTSGHSNVHRAVATVLHPLMVQNPSLKVPTRSMMLQVLAFFKRFPKGGQMYEPDLLHRLAAIMFDYVKQRRSLEEQGLLPAHLADHNLSFNERLLKEIEYLEREHMTSVLGDNGQKPDGTKIFSQLSLRNEDPLLVEELTRPVALDELLHVTHNSGERKRERESIPAQITPPTESKNHLRKQRRRQKPKIAKTASNVE